MHTYLDKEIKPYHNWHKKAYSNLVHWSILSLYVVSIVVAIIFGIFANSLHSTKATVTNCTWTNAAGTNNWSTAGNWSCNAVPDNTFNVIFDGAVSNSPITIDVAASAASFTTKGANLPTTGDIAYTGTITANADLTLDTTNGGTGNFYLGGGTYVAGSTTITVPGNWTKPTGGGTFTQGTSTVIFPNTSTISATTFYNLHAAADGTTSTFGDQTTVTGLLTTGTGTMTGYTWFYFSGSGTLVHGGATINGTIDYRGSAGSVTVPGGRYYGLVLEGWSSYVAGGDIIVGNGFTMTWGNNSLNLNGYNLNVTGGITIGNSSYTASITNTGSGTISATGNVAIGTNGTVNLSSFSGNFNVGGTWTNAGTFTSGTSTVNFNGTGTQTINMGGTGTGKSFYNLTHSGSGTIQPLTNALDVNGNFSQTAGTFNNGNSLALYFAGDFNLAAGTTWTKFGNTLTFDGTTSYSDLTATSQNIGAVTLNGTSLTIASGTMQTDALTVTAGNLIQTNGNIKTSGAISIAASQNWTNNGTGDVTLGGNVTNAGTVSFDGDEAGGIDPISILSSATSARTWTASGSGTFSFTDVSVSYQTGASTITTTSSNDGGNNTSWTFTTTNVISGSIYDSIGGSKVTASKTIAISVNGATATTTTSSNGDYSLTLGTPLAANDIISVFVDGDSVKASSVTKTSVAGSGINIDLYQNHTILRHEGTIASLANSDLATADNVADTDILFSVDGSSVATFTQNTYIMNNKTYAPGANVVLNSGNWANYGTFTPSTYTVTFSASSGTQTIYASDTSAAPYTGTGKAFYNLTHSATGTLQIISNLDVNGALTNSAGSLDFNSKTIFLAGTWTPTGGTFTKTGTLTMDGTANQTLTTDGQAFNDLTLNNTGAAASDRITISGNLDVDGTLTITDGVLYLTTNNPNINTSGNVIIASTGAVTKGTGTWTFDGTTTYTDNEATKSNIGPVAVAASSTATLASSMTVDTMNINADGILNLGSSAYILKLAKAGSSADVLTISGTMNVGTNSIVDYSATNSAGNVNVLAFPYNNLSFSGSESYDMTGNLTGDNALSGSVTINANSTLNTYVGTTSYDITCVNFTINQNGIVYAGAAGTSTFNISGNWWQYNALSSFNYGHSTINMTGTGSIAGGNLSGIYNINAATAGNTTTFNGLCITGVLTLGTGTAAGTSLSLNGQTIATPLVTSGATINVPITYFAGSTKNVASTTYNSLTFYGNVGGAYTLQGPITATTLTIRSGNVNQSDVVNSGGYDINCTSLTLGSSGAYNGSLNMGAGTLTVSGNVTINPSTGTYHNALSFTSGTLNLGGNFTNSDTFTYSTSTVNFTGTGTSQISGTAANTFYNLSSTTPGKTIVFPTSATQTVTNTLTVAGSSSNMIHLRSSLPGTQFNLSVPSNQAVSYVDVKDSAQTNGSYTITDSNGADGGNNNANWVFDNTTQYRYWVASEASNWNDTANWSTTSGGTSGASVPTDGYVAVFDQASGNGSYACTIDKIVAVDGIKIDGYTSTITDNFLTTINGDLNIKSGTFNALSAGTININNDLLLSGTGSFTAPSSNLNITGNFSNSSSGTYTHSSGNTTFNSTATSTKYITSGGAHFYNLIFNGNGGSWTMNDDSYTDNNFIITAGTVIAGSTTLNVGGNWTATGTFTYNTSTVNLTGTGTFDGSFYNLNAAAAGKTSTSATITTVTHVLTLGTGSLAGGGTYIALSGSGTPLVNAGATIASTTVLRYMYSGAVNLAPGTYGVLAIAASSTGALLTGDVTCVTLRVQAYSSGSTATLDTNGYNITATTLTVGGSTTYYGILKNTSSTVSTINVNGTLSNLVGTASGNNQFLANNININVTGNWTNTDVFTAGNSTVTLTGNSAAHQTITTNAQPFYNLTINNTQTTYNQAIISGTLTVNGAFNLNAGILKLDTNNPAVNLYGDVSVAAGTTWTKGSGAVTFKGTTSYSDLTSTPQNIGAVTLNGTSLTIASGTMQTDALTVTAGNLIQTNGNIKTTGAVSIAASQNWTNNGTGDVTLGGNVTNAGTVTFDGDETNGGQDPIVIASSSTSTRQWEKSGSGTFSFTDVSVSYQTVGTTQGTITVTNGNNGGNNTNWIFGTSITISGSLYDNIGGSKVTASKTIAVSVNGNTPSTTTSSSGDYSITLSAISANDIVTVYVDGDSVQASTVTKTSLASADIGINLFQNYTVIRHEGTISSITYSDLATADNVADTDILFSVDGSNIATFTKGVYILAGKTYAPGANIIVQGNLYNAGSFTQSTNTVTFDGSSTIYGSSITTFNNLTINSGKALTSHATNINITGNFTNNGTFTHNSGTVTFNGTSNQTVNTNAQSFNNFIIYNTGAAASDRITISGDLDINGNLTITDGVLYLTTNNPNVNIAGNVAIASTGAITKGSGTWTFDGTTAATYSDLESTVSNIGTVSLNKTDTVSPSSNNKLTLSTSMTVDNLAVDGTLLSEDYLNLGLLSTSYLTVTTGGTTTIGANGQILGSGILRINDTAGANLTETGTINSKVRFDATTANATIPARTYGGIVEAYTAATSSRTITLGTATSQTINFSSNLNPITTSTSSSVVLSVRADTYNPTINIGGDYTVTTPSSTSSYTKLYMGSSTWTLSGNFSDYQTGNCTAAHQDYGTSTIIFNGSSKTITGLGCSNVTKFYNLTINNNTTISNVLTSHDVTVNSGYTLNNTSASGFLLNGGTLAVQDGATLSGSTVKVDTSTSINSTGTITAPIAFRAIGGNISARTYGGAVSIIDEYGSNYTVTMGTANSQTINFNGGLTIGTSSTGSLITTFATYNPTVNITGSFTTTKTSSGTNTVYLGSSTYNISGNVSFANSNTTIQLATINLTGNGLQTQTLNANNVPLYNLTHSGTGTVQLITNPLVVNGNLTNSAGYFNANNLNITVGGSLNNTAAFTNTTSTNLTLNGATSGNVVRSNNASFNNVSLNAPGADGPVGWWKMDEGTGTSTTADASGNTNTGTLSGSTKPTWTSSVNNTNFYGGDPYGMSFNGTTAYIDNGNGASLNLTSSISAAVWVKGAAQSGGSVVGRYDYGNNKRSWAMYGCAANTSKITVTLSDDGTYTSGHSKDYCSSLTALDNTWHYVAFTFDGSSLKLYVDGILDTGVTKTYDAAITSLYNANINTLIGARFNNSAAASFFSGSLDDVRIYNCALSAFEINTLYLGTNPTNGSYTLSDSLDVNGNFTSTAGSLDLNDQNVNIAGDVTINGGTITKGNGTVTFDGDQTYTDNVGGTNFGNVVIGASPDTTDLASDFTADSLSISSGDRLNTNGYELDINGDITVNSTATLDATDDVETDNSQINLTGNWSNSGTFTADNSTVTFDGTNQAISGSTTFYNLSKADSTNDSTDLTLTFDNTATQTIGGLLTFDGLDDNDRVNLVSNSPSTAWELALHGSAVINYVDVADSDASTGSQVDATDGTNTNSGNNTNWSFSTGIAISGSCKAFDQSTNCTDGQTVKVAINNSRKSLYTTTSSGTFTISNVPVNSGDIVTVFLDNVADANEANAVTKYDGSGDISGILLYAEHLTIGSDDNATLTNADLSNYDNSVSSDEDVFFDVDANNDLTVDATSQSTQERLYIKTGNSFRPDSTSSGNVTTHHMQIVGTVTADGNTFTVGGDWNHSTGTFNANTSTVTLTGTGNLTVYDYYSFYNLVCADTGKVTTLSVSHAIYINYVLTLGSGELAGSKPVQLLANNATPLVTSGATINTPIIYSAGCNIASTTYSNYVSMVLGTFTLLGPITAQTIYLSPWNAGQLATLNTNGYSITTTTFNIGSASANRSADVNASTSTITVNGDLTIYPSDSSTVVSLSFTTGTLNVGGNFANNDVFTAGTGTIDFTKASGTQTLNSGGTGTGKDFYNITHSGAGTLQLLTNNIKATGNFLNSGGTFTTLDSGDGTTSRNVTVDGNFTINGSSTVTVNASTITVGGNWDSSAGTFTPGASTVDLINTGYLKTANIQNSPFDFYNVNLAHNTKTTTLQNRINVGNVVSMYSGGTVTGFGFYMFNSSSDPVNNTGATITNTYLVYRSTGNLTVAGQSLGTNSDLYYEGIGNVTFTLSSGTNSRNLYIASTSSPNTTTLNTNGNNINATTLCMSVSTMGNGIIQLNSGSHTIGSIVRASGSIATGNVIDFGTSNTSVSGDINYTGISTTPGTSTINFTKASGTQTFNSVSQSVNNLTHSGAGTLQISTSALDINGNFSQTAGIFDSNSQNMNIAGNFSLSNSTTFTKGGTLTFDGTAAATITDSNTTLQDLGTVVINKTDTVAPSTNNKVTLGSSITLDTLNIDGTLLSEDYFDLSTLGGYTLTIAGTGATADVFTVGANTVLQPGNSTVLYTALNSGGNVNIATTQYNNLTFTPASAESYDMTGNLTSTYAMTGDLTINANATMNTYVGTTSYDLSCNDATVNTSGTLYAGTNDTAGSSTLNISGNFTAGSGNGTFTRGQSTVNLTGTGSIITGGSLTLYNLNAAAEGYTTTYNAIPLSIKHTLTLGTGTYKAAVQSTMQTNLNSAGTPLVTSGATLTQSNISYQGTSAGTNVASTTYGTLWIMTDGRTATLAGDITTGALQVRGSAINQQVTLDASGHNITASSLAAGESSASSAGGIINMNGGSATVSGNVTIYSSDATRENSINFTSGTLSVGGNFVNSDTFTPGTSTVDFTKASGTQTVNNGSSSFNNLTHSGAGTLQISTNALDINGNFTNSAGTFDANGLNVNVAKNWDISGGAFSAGATPGTQTVTFDGTSAATISGSSTFNNLVMNTTTDGAKQINFTNNTTQTINGTWTLDGDTSKVLTLRSSTTDSPWYFDLPSGMTSGDYIDVQDSYSADTNKITPGANVTNSGNNDGWIFDTNTAPDNPTTLAQKKTTDVTIATGNWNNDDAIKFTAEATDTDTSDTLYLCIEKDALGTAFSNTEDSCGSGVAYSGTAVAVTDTIDNITDATEYHWQARIKDEAGEYSDWVSYDVNLETVSDFGIDTTAPTGGTVYDGTSAGNDANYNDGSLSSLSANWSGFDATASGLQKYEYAIGTTTGLTDVKTWTDNGTNTSVTVSSLTLRTGQTYYFRVRATDNAGSVSTIKNSNGQAVTPTLTFTYNSGSSVNFDDLNAGNSFTDSTKSTVLQVSTNAYGGYVVKARALDELRMTSNTNFFISHYAGTNASPTTWSGLGFGYTTSDDNLSGGTADRFTNGGPKYAGWTETGPGDPVADHTATVTGSPITDEQFTISYRVTGNATTAAGRYNTTIIYTAIPQY